MNTYRNYFRTCQEYKPLLWAVLFVLSIAGLVWLLNQPSLAGKADNEQRGEMVIVERDPYFDYTSFGLPHPQFGDDVELDKGGMPVVPDHDPSTGELPQSKPEGHIPLMPYPLPMLPGWRAGDQVITRPYVCAREVPVPGTLWLVGVGLMALVIWKGGHQ